MTLATAAPSLLVLPALLLVFALVVVGLLLRTTGRLDLRRSVLVHVPLASAWRRVRHFPSLHARHGKMSQLGPIDDWVLRQGDGEGAGSIWRAVGRCGDSPYWADVEIVIAQPGRQMAITLLRDSLGTERGVREHLGAMRLEELGPGTTKVTWRLRARLHGARLRAERLLSLTRLQARLFDQGLRSLKASLEKDFALENDLALREDSAREAFPPRGEPAGAGEPPPRAVRGDASSPIPPGSRPPERRP